MNTSVFHRRRAERFAQLLDEAGGARRHHARSGADQDLTNYVDVSNRLARIDFGVQADPEFRDGLRAMLMATIEREGIGATAVRTEPDHDTGTARSPLAWIPVRSKRARGAVVIGLAVGTLAVSGMSAASGGAIPGDALYGMKRSTEQAQLALASSQVGRGQLYLEFAKTRVNEATAVAGGAAGLDGVLNDMDEETKQGVRLLTTSAVDRHDAAPLDAISAFTGDQQHAMSGVLANLTGDAHTRTEKSMSLLDQINQRVAGLRQSLNCSDDRSAASDDLGPLPRYCSAAGITQPSTVGGANGATAGGSTRGSSGSDTEAGGAATGTAPDATQESADPSATSDPAQGTDAQENQQGPAASPQTRTSTTPSKPRQHGDSGDDGIIDRLGHLLGG